MAQRGSEITNEDLALLCRQAGSLIHAEVNILDVLEALRNQSDKAQMVEIIDSVRHDLEMGRTLATAFSRYPNNFSPFFISMIRQGELEGELDQAFLNLAQHYESRLGGTVDARRMRGGAGFDWEAAATAFKWIVVWLAALVSAACLAGAGLWAAAKLGAFEEAWLGPAMCLLVGLIMFLGVLLFSVRRR